MMKFIESKYVREYIEKTGFQFTDAEMATIIYQSEMLVSDKQQALLKLANCTTDQELRQQIVERLSYETTRRVRFKKNEGCFYQVVTNETNERWKRGEVLGNFASMELAVQYAMRLKIPFTVYKYQLIGICGNVILPQGIVSPRLLFDRTIERNLYEGEPIAGFSYTEYAQLKKYWTYEVTKEETAKVEDGGGYRFEHKFVRLPNPFEKGDVVRLIGTDLTGVVTTSQEEWRSFLEDVEKRNLVVDFSDAAIYVDFKDNKGGTIQGHIQPIYLEKVRVEKNGRRYDS